jgi:hypothetical protein
MTIQSRFTDGIRFAVLECGARRRAVLGLIASSLDGAEMNIKSLALLVSAFTASASTGASATTIDLAPPTEFFGQIPCECYTQDGYTFTNSAFINTTLAYAYFNPVLLNPSFNASNPNGDIGQNYANTSNTITNNAKLAFDFSSIGLASIYNDGTGGNVTFTFNHVGGGSDSQTVTLLSGVSGLQTFTFNETDLTSVVFTPTTTYGPFIQFDNVGVNLTDPVPLHPLPLLGQMLLLGLGGFGLLAYRRRQSLESAF